MVFGDLAEGVIDPVQLAVRAAGVGASANGVVAVLAGDRFAVFALAGLGQYPACRISLCALGPEAGVFPVGDVPGGVVLEVDVSAIGGRAAVNMACGIPAQLPLLAIGAGDGSQAFAEIVLVPNLMAIGSAIRQRAHQWAVFVAVLVALGVGVVGQAASLVVLVLAAAFLIRGLFRILVYGQQALALVVVMGDQALFQFARYAAIRLVSKALKRPVVSTCQHLPGVGAPQIHGFTAAADSLGGPAFGIVPVLPLAAIGANFAEQTARQINPALVHPPVRKHLFGTESQLVVLPPVSAAIGFNGFDFAAFLVVMMVRLGAIRAGFLHQPAQAIVGPLPERAIRVLPRDNATAIVVVEHLGVAVSVVHSGEEALWLVLESKIMMPLFTAAT